MCKTIVFTALFFSSKIFQYFPPQKKASKHVNSFKPSFVCLFFVGCYFSRVFSCLMSTLQANVKRAPFLHVVSLFFVQCYFSIGDNLT